MFDMFKKRYASYELKRIDGMCIRGNSKELPHATVLKDLEGYYEINDNAVIVVNQEGKEFIKTYAINQY